jgi:hypothetical protein
LIEKEPSGESGLQKAPFSAPIQKVRRTIDDEQENHLLFGATFIDFSQTGFTLKA